MLKRTNEEGRQSLWGFPRPEITWLEYPIDNRNGNINVGLIRTYFVYSFYNVEKDEKIHLKNSSTLLVKRGCYTIKDIEKVSSGKVKYDSLTVKSIIDSIIS